jgi:hypothetical protein
MNNKLATMVLTGALVLWPASNALAEEEVKVASNAYSQEVLELLAEAERYGVTCTWDMNRLARQWICEQKIDTARLEANTARLNEKTAENIAKANKILQEIKEQVNQ